jgi:P4 family phage/plasmid primase-like protien
MGVLEEVERYLEWGWKVIPLQPGAKRPISNGWQNMELGTDDVAGVFGSTPVPNVGVLLGTGGAVDIDLDSREAQLLAPYFLPKTDAIFGRRSKRRSHWLYRITEPPHYRIFSDPRPEHKGEVLFEVRSDASHQTMMPPSTHPSGEKVEWYEEGVPALATASDLLPRVARLAAASLLAKVWPEKGSRHQATIHLAGGLLRAGWKVEYVEKYVTAICNVAGDVKEVEDRTRAVRDTAKDLADGGNVTGWPTLTEVLGSDVVRAVTDWLQVGGATAKTALTDLGNAERLISQYQPNIRYCPQTGHWLIWDGRRWAEDEGERILQLAAETARSVFLEAAKETDSDRAQQIAKWAIASQNINRLQAIPRAARSFPQIQVNNDDLDKDPWLLNCPNGTLNLRTGGLQPFNKEDYITKMAGTDFDPDAHCPIWEKFLLRVLHNDGEMVSFLQRAVGYSLTGSTREQRAFMLFGTGANGKTTFIETVRAVLGEYARNTEFSTFLQRSSDSVRTDIARLKGARLVTASESEEGRKLATALVKTITGGELVTARFLYQSEFEYRPVLKMWLATNHKPVVRDNSRGFWRRITLIPFTVQIPESEWDRDLRIKLTEHELAGILNFLSSSQIG